LAQLQCGDVAAAERALAAALRAFSSQAAGRPPGVPPPVPAADLPDAVATPGLDPRDQAMLADPDLELARAADFYAWYAAGHPVPVDESGAHATAAEQPSAALETVDDETN
ncbi:hypothetical protein, partial [Xanthomonas perforans]|uniref:hypothetical protein n=1 Tax=Xanthomonas perforans TaxID=442694 RepID=UPI001F48C9E2